MTDVKQKSFQEELCSLINYHSRENGSDTPDFLLAEYLNDCLAVFDRVTRKRTEWYSPEKENTAGLNEPVRDFRNQDWEQ